MAGRQGPQRLRSILTKEGLVRVPAPRYGGMSTLGVILPDALMAHLLASPPPIGRKPH